jgi:putative DNA primase/helicase
LALCPTWDSFLAQVLPDEKTRDYLGRLLGYSCAGVIKEHVFVVLWGQTGRNGKGTLIETVFAALGAYAAALPNDVIIESRNDPHPNMFAQLLGVRLGVMAELRPSDRLNEGMLKKLSGGDTVRARFMGGEFFSFPPSAKLFSQTNYKPKVRGGDPALWARIRVIPFGVSFAGREDLTLPTRLRAELPGIAAWLVRHCLAWQSKGLTPPPEVAEATAEYREESDRVGQFLSEKTTPAPMGRVSAAALWRAFRSWCEDRGEAPGAQNTFGAEVKARGTQTMRVGGERRYIGLVLASAGDQADSADSHNDRDGDAWM